MKKIDIVISKKDGNISIKCEGNEIIVDANKKTITAKEFYQILDPNLEKEYQIVPNLELDFSDPKIEKNELNRLFNLVHELVEKSIISINQEVVRIRENTKLEM